MKRLALLLLLVPCACASLTLTRGAAGWQLESKGFLVEPVRDGRMMPDGWLLQNYDKVSKGAYAQRRPAELDLTFSRSDDDGILAVEELQVDRKKLRVLIDRFVNDLRTRQLEVQAGNFVARVEVDEPVVELASAAVEGESVEGYEIIVSQTHPGERQPYLQAYLALVRRSGSPQAVFVSYFNTPAAFLAGLDDVRGLTRRLKVSGASLSAELPALAPGEKKPAAGAPIRL